MQTSVEQLVERLRKDGWNIPDGWRFSRLYPGYWQRSAGAWVWFLRHDEHGTLCGSPDSVKACLKSERLTHGKTVGTRDTIYAE